MEVYEEATTLPEEGEDYALVNCGIMSINKYGESIDGWEPLTIEELNGEIDDELGRSRPGTPRTDIGVENKYWSIGLLQEGLPPTTAMEGTAVQRSEGHSN